MDTSAGAGIITVQALYDGNGNFYPDGKTFAISTNSTSQGVKNMPISVAIPGSSDPVASADLLSVKTEEQGTLLLNLTEEEYIELIRDASPSPGGSSNLQQVTDNGNITTKEIDVVDGDGNTRAALSPLGIVATTSTDGATGLAIVTLDGGSINELEYTAPEGSGHLLAPSLTSNQKWILPDASGTVIIGHTGTILIQGNGSTINFAASVPSGYNSAYASLIQNRAPGEHAVIMNAEVSGTILNIGIYSLEGAPISGSYTCTYLLTAI